MKKPISFRLNGRATQIEVDPERTLLWVLRTDLGLTGTKYGCGKGICGSCTVLLESNAVRACRLTVRAVADKRVTTIEGLARNGELHPLQRAFIDHGALQCGYCTPGMLLSARSLLLRSPAPNRGEIIAHMEDNLCRCGSHARIIEAIRAAAETMKGVES
jgi:carbon-monoxide dehydrogenase small subunit